MATTRKTAATKAAPKTATKAAADTSALESRVADLEAKIEVLTAAQSAQEAACQGELAKLAEKCDACCQGGSGADLDLREQLKRYFKTLVNPKRPTEYPTID